MRQRLLWVFAALVAGPCMGQGIVQTGTRLPYTYVLDGGPGRLSDEEFAKQVALGPPRLQHMQSGSVVHSYWGDFDALRRARLRGQGQTVPSPDYLRLYTERIERLRRLNAAMHDGGCEKIVSYICIMTIGGDPAKRTGYWEFYDHWSDLLPLGIGPKPATDPEEWNQRKADGSPHHFYRKEHPAYRPMYRYSQCLNNPHWQQYIRWVVKMNARAGYDGNFVDNANSHRCHCGRCQRLFEEYLSGKYTAEDRRALFADGIELSEAKDTLLGAETRRFWAATVHRFLALIREAGAQERGSWFVYPNGLCRRQRSAVTSFRDCDLAMNENSVGEFGTHPGTVFEEVIAGIGLRHVNDNIFCHRHTYAANSRVRAALLTRAGYPRYNPGYAMNVDTAALGLAEAAAFGAGGAFLHRPASGRWALLAEVRKQFNHFFTTHRDLYEGYVPYGRVALAVFAEQQYYSDRQHIALARVMLNALMAEHVLVDVFTERKWDADMLRHCRALVLPGVRYMSDEQVAIARDFAKRGKLVTIGGCGSHDLAMCTRAESPFGSWELPARTTAIMQAFGQAGCAAPVLAERKPSASLVRVAAYVDSRLEPCKLVLHVVDYAVSLGVDAAPAEPVRNLRVALPLPGSSRPTSVTLASPQGEDQPLAFRVEGGAVCFTIPTMRIYCMCSIALVR